MADVPSKLFWFVLFCVVFVADMVGGWQAGGARCLFLFVCVARARARASNVLNLFVSVPEGKELSVPSFRSHPFCFESEGVTE